MVAEGRLRLPQRRVLQRDSRLFVSTYRATCGHDGAVHTDGSVDIRRREKVRGCLLGAACGDELGAAFEGAPQVADVDLDAWLAADERLRATDDSIMMRVLAEHLTGAAGGAADLDEDALMDAFVGAFRRDPWRGYGPGTAGLLQRVARGVPWQEAATAQFGGTGSLGNGGAMRVAPIGLLPLPRSGIADLARRSAAVTHAHPLGTQGAELQAGAVALAYPTDPGEPLDRDDFLTRLSRLAPRGEYAERIERVRGLPAAPSAADVVAQTGNDITALSAVPAAIAAFVLHPDVPADTVRFAISMGGDTDTIATMAGAVAGARCGESALLAGWLQRLEDPDGWRRVADELAVAHPGTPPL